MAVEFVLCNTMAVIIHKQIKWSVSSSPSPQYIVFIIMCVCVCLMHVSLSTNKICVKYAGLLN